VARRRIGDDSWIKEPPAIRDISPYVLGRSDLPLTWFPPVCDQRDVLNPGSIPRKKEIGDVIGASGYDSVAIFPLARITCLARNN
jgi:hypothetical protein